MPPRVIAVRGVNNCGKSTAIKLAYQRLLADSESVIPVSRHLKEVRGAVMVRHGVRVGWISLGDIGRILEEGFANLVAERCAVIVCACRSHGGTIEYLDSLGYEVTWIKKQRVEGVDQEHANQTTAARVAKAVDQAIESVLAQHEAALSLFA
jgi:ABC-type cobalamin/Fe3+-siderophores transport system ATPase subunit